MIESNGQTNSRVEFNRLAVGLLSQQLWCWGQDILRAEGNWLLEVGFNQLPPPPEREGQASVYTLVLPGGQCVTLRGFGVFYGDRNLGGIFLPRYEFQPLYTPNAFLVTVPWTSQDLPELHPPDASQLSSCIQLAQHLFDWIRDYEVNVIKQLGIGYRQSTLTEWDDGEKPVIPAEEIAYRWRWLGNVFADFCLATAKTGSDERAAG